jgi:tetratricopeptide (TPR) repeat protein
MIEPAADAAAALEALPSDSTRLIRPHTTHFDVWSRWGGRYRVRAVLLLALNALMFAGLGSFAFWLRTGEPFAPRVDSYWRQLGDTLDFRDSQNQISLTTMLIEPMSVREVPAQIPILGFLMAALISIPIIVSILYRFWSAVPFILAVAFLAMMPWLAITLTASCIVASVKPFRTTIRFISALLGLVPASIYLYLASEGTNQSAISMMDPIERMKFIAPWVVAIVASAVVCAVVLALARLVNYRPGMITPLMLMLFLLPFALFEKYVGADELHYRLLEGLDRYTFLDRDTSMSFAQAVQWEWDRHPLPRPNFEVLRSEVETLAGPAFAGYLEPRRLAVERQRADLILGWNDFLRRFPASRYVHNALYLQARGQSMRIDEIEYARTRWVRYDDDFPASGSRVLWRRLVENDPPQALRRAALLRIAQLDARAGDVERALDELNELLRSSRNDSDVKPAEAGVLERKGPLTSLDLDDDDTLIEAHRLRDLISANDDARYGYDPLCGSAFDSAGDRGLLDLDPRSSAYLGGLRNLRARYTDPPARLLDNIELEIAKAARSDGPPPDGQPPIAAEQIQLLNRLLSHRPDGDAVPEALFRLGIAYRDNGQAAASQHIFGRLLAEHPGTIWAGQARAAVHSPLGFALTDVRTP